jgi:hypothetical protein
MATEESKVVRLANQLGFYEGVRYQPALIPGAEAGILWLRPLDHYPVFLRETNTVTTKPVQFGRNRWEHDGGKLVAVAIAAPLRKQFPVYSRRVWWVKHYDAFHGYRVGADERTPGRSSYIFGTRFSAEAVDPASIAPNQESGPLRTTYNLALLIPASVETATGSELIWKHRLTNDDEDVWEPFCNGKRVYGIFRHTWWCELTDDGDGIDSEDEFKVGKIFVKLTSRASGLAETLSDTFGT